MHLPHALLATIVVLAAACVDDGNSPVKVVVPGTPAPAPPAAQPSPSPAETRPAPAPAPSPGESAGDPPAAAKPPAAGPNPAAPAPAAGPVANPAPAPAPAPAATPQDQPAPAAPAAQAPPPQEATPQTAPSPPPAADGKDGAPAAPKPAAADDDAKAREILAKAAARQNAGDLAKPGALESFHVVFHKATFEREKTKSDGSTTNEMVEVDTDGLVMKWKKGSLRTDVTVDGNTTAKAWYQPMKIGWIFDGKRVASLAGADRKNDNDELQFHRRVVDQLLDVAILDKMLHDGSKWTVLPDSAPYANAVALRRTPPDGAANAAALTLWIDHPSADEWGDVIAAATPPSADVAATLRYEFKYNDSFPAVRVKSGDGEPAASKLRFPFQVIVHQQGRDEPKPRKVLEVFTKSVDLNTVADGDFAQPKKGF